MTTKDSSNSTFTSKLPTWLIAVIPLVLLAGLVILFINTNPIQVHSSDLPPVEDISFQRITLPQEGLIVMEVTNAGPDPVTIAQIIIDEAYWQFSISPGNTLNRLETASIEIAYPWVDTEPHEITIITSTGATFAGEIELATLSPESGPQQFWAYGLVGLYVGIIPVGLGLLWYPAMRRMGRVGMNFALSLTIGLLVFLFIDTMLEAFEVSEMLPGVFQGIPLAIFTALITWLAISAIGSRKLGTQRETPGGRRFIALLIALGIGFHNLGEGLVVGAAFALGEASLGSFLVIGFILHNITEGIGIVAPISKDRPSTLWFLAMLLLAGGPAILGTWIGGFAFSPLLGVIFLGIGMGAIWQVIFEVGLLLQRDAERSGGSLVTWPNFFGLLIGILVMYVTAFLVKF